MTVLAQESMEGVRIVAIAYVESMDGPKIIGFLCQNINVTGKSDFNEKEHKYSEAFMKLHKLAAMKSKESEDIVKAEIPKNSDGSNYKNQKSNFNEKELHTLAEAFMKLHTLAAMKSKEIEDVVEAEIPPNSDGEADDMQEEENSGHSSDSGFLRPKRSPDSAEGDGDIEGDADKEDQRGNSKFSFDWSKKFIPIYERSADQTDHKVGEASLVGVKGYYTFARMVVAAYPHHQEEDVVVIPHVLWPWNGYTIQYKSRKDGREESLDPISKRWEEFVPCLSHIVAIKHQDTNLLPVKFQGYDGFTVDSHIHKNFVGTWESFLTIVDHLAVAWYRQESCTKSKDDESIEPQIFNSNDYGFSSLCSIYLYGGDGNTLDEPWCDTDNDEAEDDKNVDFDDEAEDDENVDAVDDEVIVEDPPAEGEEDVEVNHEDDDQSNHSGDDEDRNYVKTALLESADLEWQRERKRIQIIFDRFYAKLKSIVIKIREF